MRKPIIIAIAAAVALAAGLGLWLVLRPGEDPEIARLSEVTGLKPEELRGVLARADARLKSLGIDLDAHPELTTEQRASLRLAATGEPDAEVRFYTDIALAFQGLQTADRNRALAFAEPFFKEASGYVPQALGSPDDREQVRLSRRASGSALILAAAWAARGPFDHLRAQYEALAIRLATCRDLELRRHAAILLWVMKHVPETRALSPEAERALEVTLAPDRVQPGYARLLDMHRRNAIAAGARWPEGVAP